MNYFPLHIHTYMYYPNLIKIQVGGMVKINLKKTSLRIQKFKFRFDGKMIYNSLFAEFDE